MIQEYLSSNPIFGIYLSNFLKFFNPEIDWIELFDNWKKKNKNDNQILENIKSKCWIDQSLEFDEHKLDKFRFIYNLFKDIKIKALDEIYILDCKYKNITVKIEQEFEFYKDLLEIYLKSHLINFKYISKIDEINNSKNYLIDLGWMFLNKSELKKIWKMDNLIHFNLFGLDMSIDLKYIEEFIKIYKFIRKDF